MSGAEPESTIQASLGKLLPDRRIFFPDAIKAKRVEYEDLIDPISGEDEDAQSYDLAEFQTAEIASTEEELSATNDTVISYVLFPSSAEELYH